jgi:hypothetical protein
MNQKLVNQNSDTGLMSSLEGEISNAIESMLGQFKDRKKGLRILSTKMGIHEKTLNRILNKENKPGYQTVFKIYRVFFNEYNDAKILNLVSENVRDFLQKSNSQELTGDKNYTTNADLELQKNPIISELYIIAATGPITHDQVEYRFGKYGIELLVKMLEKGLLHEAQKNVYIIGNNHPVFSGETIVSIGSAMIAGHAKPSSGEEMGNNFISFYAEGLSPEAYNEWLAIDQKANQKKFELSRDPKNLGSVRAFTFMITENIELKNLQ